MAARLSRLDVQGLRCLHGMTLTLEDLTAMIGANGAGKSSTVRAVQFLFGEVDLDDDDVTDGLSDPEVAVTATFTGLPDAWRQRLEPWLNDDGDLVVRRTRVVGVDGRPTARWGCDRTQAPGFAAIRGAAAAGASAADLKAAYADLRTHTADLPAWTSKAQALAALDAYEQDNPEALTEKVPDPTLHFGGGDDHDLSAMIEMLVLPAMRDAVDDSAETRGSTLARLVDITVRSQVDLDAELTDLTERTGAEYQRIVDTQVGPRLEELSVTITRQIASFAPGAQVKLSWDPRLPSLSAPAVRARIVESGHEGDIGRQGHGVQRAYVFSLLRALLDARRLDATDERPGLLLVVEEPEVYQHPLRARYVARTLAELARDTAQSTQVLYTTHSPYFVSVDNVPSVRLLRLTSVEESPSGWPLTRASAATLAALAERLDEAREGGGQKWTPERVAAQLPGLLGSTVSEGLFADVVVLTEGDEDVGMIDGAASAGGLDLAADGVAVIAVDGKDNLLLASEVFRALAVPVYMVFDTDEKPAGEHSDGGALRLNAMLTHLADGVAQERPPTTVTGLWAAAKPSLRAVVDDEIGADVVREAFVETARSMGLPESTAKNGHLVRTAVSRLYRDGHRSETVDKIIDAVAALGRSGEPARPAAEVSEGVDTV